MTNSPTGRRNAVILTADQFEDLEVIYPLFRLTEAGWNVAVAAPVMEEIEGEHGYIRLQPDLLIQDVDPDAYELLLIPGGSPTGAPSVVRKIEKAREITRSFFSGNKPVASICHGPWTLADAGVIKGRHLTSIPHDHVPEDIRQAGGLWSDKEVIVDGNLVTSRHPADLPAFMREVMRLVSQSA